MTEILNNSPTKDLLNKLAGLDNSAGDERLKRIVQRVVSDAFRTIEEFDVTPEEFWTAMSYLTQLGKNNEVGLLAPGLGFEHRADERLLLRPARQYERGHPLRAFQQGPEQRSEPQAQLFGHKL